MNGSWIGIVILLGLAFLGCWALAGSAVAAVGTRSWALAVVAVALAVALGAEVGTLNGAGGPALLGAISLVTVVAATVAFAALAVHLLSEPARPQPVRRRGGPDTAPDSEA